MREGIVVMEDGEDIPVHMVDGVRILDQDFEIPEGALPVRMQVGDAPVCIIGWTDGTDGATSGLLRKVADQLEELERER